MSVKWATPKGFPDWVQVSTDGRVRLLERRIVRANGAPQTIRAKELKYKKDVGGYLCVQFRVNGKNKGYRVHRLVLLAHAEGEGTGLDANHKNGIRTDNRIENLEWCARSENHRHAYRVLGRKPYWKGKEPPNKGRYNTGVQCRPIIGIPVNGGPSVSFPTAAEAGRNGFSMTGIRHCLIGDQKTANGHRWYYADEKEKAA